jgi:hypothetical protein
MRFKASRARILLEQEAFPIVAAAAVVAGLARAMPQLLLPDTWLALVAGRLIAADGLPHRDTLTFWTLGRSWTDQQWAAHLLLYEAAHVGGLRTAIAVGMGCVAAAVVLIAVVARRLGGSPRSASLGALLPIVASPWLAQVRAQSFGVVCFVLVYSLLVCDSRRSGSRVLFVVPLLVAWANLHGSVVIGAGLVVLHGLFLARQRADRFRGVMLAVAAPVCVLASPLALRLPRYYELMLVDRPFAGFTNEWRPPSVSGPTAIFFATVVALAALWGAHRRTLTLLERWTLPLLLVLALTAIRNIDWFVLAAAIGLPRMLDRAWPPQTGSRRLNLYLSTAALVAGTSYAVIQFMHAPATLLAKSQPQAAAAISKAAGATGLVFADDVHADWLLWFQPTLQGRVMYDSRFELLDRAELETVHLLENGIEPVQPRCATRARVIVFTNPAFAQRAVRNHVLAPGSRTIVYTTDLAAFAQPFSREDGSCMHQFALRASAG